MMEQVYEYSTENGLPCQKSGNLIVFLFQLKLYMTATITHFLGLSQGSKPSCKDEL